jgi:hypothetical protein
MGGIWAFADDDAYVMGSIWQGIGSERQFHLGLHWNGSEWSGNINGTIEDIKHVTNDVTGDKFYMVSVGNWSIDPSKPGIGEFDNRTKKWKGFQFEAKGELRAVWTDGNGFFVAAGDNGMVYTKNGYNTGWVFEQAPTEFHFSRMTGVSKREIYIHGVLSMPTGEYYHQLWKLGDGNWQKLLDTREPEGMPIHIPETGETISDVAAFRCARTDSLYLYLTGWESFRFESEGQDPTFTKINLRDEGLPLRAIGQSAWQISVFSPKDIWIRAARYQIWHWNGTDYRKIEPVPSWPYGQLWGSISRMQKSESGKVWMLLETNNQVYSVVQGTP